MWYHVSEPNSYLAITGVSIDKVCIVKKAVVWPFQRVTKISITPFDFSMSLQGECTIDLNREIMLTDESRKL